MKKFFAVAALLVAMSGVSYAACTEDEMTKKAEAFAAALEAAEAKNPTLAKQVLDGVTPHLEKAAAANDINGLCEVYDGAMPYLK